MDCACGLEFRKRRCGRMRQKVDTVGSAHITLLRTVIFDTLMRSSSMRFDGFVRVVEVTMHETELFLHFGKYETKKQSA